MRVEMVKMENLSKASICLGLFMGMILLVGCERNDTEFPVADDMESSVAEVPLIKLCLCREETGAQREFLSEVPDIPGSARFFYYRFRGCCECWSITLAGDISGRTYGFSIWHQGAPVDVEILISRTGSRTLLASWPSGLARSTNLSLKSGQTTTGVDPDAIAGDILTLRLINHDKLDWAEVRLERIRDSHILVPESNFSDVPPKFDPCDVEPPRIISSSPLDGADGVDPEFFSEISVTFSEPVITEDVKVILEPLPAPLVLAWAENNALLRVTWPGGKLSLGTLYTLTIKNVRDHIGNTLVEEKVTFMTFVP